MNRFTDELAAFFVSRVLTGKGLELIICTFTFTFWSKQLKNEHFLRKQEKYMVERNFY